MNIDLEDEDRYIPSGASKKKSPVQAAKSPKNGNTGKKPMKDADRFRLALRKFRSKDRKQEYPAIIELLTTYAENAPDHLAAVKMLGFALAETGQFRDSLHYFKNVLQVNKNDVEALNAVAFLSLESGSAEDSINYLLDAIYVDKKNERLKKNLERLRNIRDAKLFFGMTRPSDFIFIEIPSESYSSMIAEKILELPSTPVGKLTVVAAILIAAVIVIYLAYPAFVSWSQNVRFNAGLGKGRITHVTIQDIDRLVEERENYDMKLTAAQIKEKFGLARTFLEEKRRNQALILINELLNSNASDAIKERVRLLKEFIPEPDRAHIDFNPDVREVVKMPFIYENVAVQWDGTAANLEYKGRDETIIDLLINFVDKATVEGIAEVHYAGYREIDSGKKFSVFGVITGVSVENKVVVKGLELQVIKR